jgi:hypothetical protein
VSAPAPADSLPEPAPGSARYFVLLYCPRPRRRALATLLAVTDELDAGRARGMDHAVAHLRLEWWRAELQRFAGGTPQHPWLSAWLHERPQDRSLALEQLTEAAAIDLAGARLAAGSEPRLYAVLFVLAAQLLSDAAPSGQLEQRLQALGCYAATLERGASARPPLPPERRAQPALTALLVWVALAERAAARGPRAAGRFDMLADNLHAWRAARRAQRGRFARRQERNGESR